MIEFYDPDGDPLTIEEWHELFARRFTDPDQSWWRKRTVISVDVEVSTVWIGIDEHAWESQIFGGDHTGDQWRYPTREAAYAHHDWLVTALRQTIDPSSRLSASTFEC